MKKPSHLLIWVLISAEQVARKLEGRVFTGLIAAARHVAIQNSCSCGIEGFN